MSLKTGSAAWGRTARALVPPHIGGGAARTTRKAVAAVAASGLVVAGLAMAAAPATAAAPAANTITVHADQPFRAVTHVATGSLYGLANATTPSDALVQAIKPNTFVMMPIGGHQQGSGDIGKTWQKAAAAGAKVVDRLSD